MFPVDAIRIVRNGVEDSSGTMFKNEQQIRDAIETAADDVVSYMNEHTEFRIRDSAAFNLAAGEFSVILDPLLLKILKLENTDDPNNRYAIPVIDLQERNDADFPNDSFVYIVQGTGDKILRRVKAETAISFSVHYTKEFGISWDENSPNISRVFTGAGANLITTKAIIRLLLSRKRPVGGWKDIHDEQIQRFVKNMVNQKATEPRYVHYVPD